MGFGAHCFTYSFLSRNGPGAEGRDSDNFSVSDTPDLGGKEHLYLADA